MNNAKTSVLDRPLPKPGTRGYARARLLEALVEARLSLRLLHEGLTRNAAGKIFQAWRALLAAILTLEARRIAEHLHKPEEKRWLTEKAIPRLPTTKMKLVSQLLERLGYDSISAWTDKALNLHDYQYHGPDPDLSLSKYRCREEAANDIILLAEKVAMLVEQVCKTHGINGNVSEELEALRRMIKDWRSG